MKHIVRLFFILIAFMVIVAGSGYLWWQDKNQSVSKDAQKSTFLIKKGQTAEDVGKQLESGKFIKSALAFKIYIQLKGLSQKIPAGEYTISPSLSLSQIVDTFLSGPTELWVSIPEGYRREEISERFIQTLEMKDVVADTFRKEFLSESQGLEGYLFPDTYLFPKDVTAKKVVDTMEANFNKRVDDKMRNDASKGGRTLNQAIILASIIERETRTDSERPVVAGLLLSRLEEGFLLQTDASLQYALANIQCSKKTVCTNWWPQITRDDYTSLQSPYNVYKYQGLPPAPISNPGISSIKAAIYPSDTEFRYYIHDLDGKIHFAKTLEDHNSNVSRYLR